MPISRKTVWFAIVAVSALNGLGLTVLCCGGIYSLRSSTPPVAVVQTASEQVYPDRQGRQEPQPTMQERPTKAPEPPANTPEPPAKTPKPSANANEPAAKNIPPNTAPGKPVASAFAGAPSAESKAIVDRLLETNSSRFADRKYFGYTLGDAKGEILKKTKLWKYVPPSGRSSVVLDECVDADDVILEFDNDTLVFLSRKYTGNNAKRRAENVKIFGEPDKNSSIGLVSGASALLETRTHCPQVVVQMRDVVVSSPIREEHFYLMIYDRGWMKAELLAECEQRKRLIDWIARVTTAIQGKQLKQVTFPGFGDVARTDMFAQEADRIHFSMPKSSVNPGVFTSIVQEKINEFGLVAGKQSIGVTFHANINGYQPCKLIQEEFPDRLVVRATAELLARHFPPKSGLINRSTDGQTLSWETESWWRVKVTENSFDLVYVP